VPDNPTSRRHRPVYWWRFIKLSSLADPAFVVVMAVALTIDPECRHSEVMAGSLPRHDSKQLFDAVFERILAIEFYFLFLGQGVHEDHTVGEGGLDMATMRTGITGSKCFLSAEVKFIDLEWATAIEIRATFEFHDQSFSTRRLRRMTFMVIFSHIQDIYKK
jgi:hypothetical protein